MTQRLQKLTTASAQKVRLQPLCIMHVVTLSSPFPSPTTSSFTDYRTPSSCLSKFSVFDGHFAAVFLMTAVVLLLYLLIFPVEVYVVARPLVSLVR